MGCSLLSSLSFIIMQRTYIHNKEVPGPGKYDFGGYQTESLSRKNSISKGNDPIFASVIERDFLKSIGTLNVPPIGIYNLDNLTIKNESDNKLKKKAILAKIKKGCSSEVAFEYREERFKFNSLPLYAIHIGPVKYNKGQIENSNLKNNSKPNMMHSKMERFPKDKKQPGAEMFR